jgi:ELWxxDGT repeat protein
VFFSKISIDVSNNGHRELWASDGLTAHLIKDVGLVNGPELVSVNPLAALGSNMLVQASIAGSGLGSQLYISDGTSLTLVKDLTAGASSSGLTPNGSLSQYLTVGNKCFFSETLPGLGGVNLWVTDGTGGGTLLLGNVASQLTGEGRGFTQFGSSIVFTASDATHGFETWISDGTAAGTHVLKDINAGVAGSDGSQYFVFNNKLFFSARGNNGAGVELWTSDGTEGGTVLFKDLSPGGLYSSPGDFQLFCTKMLFTANTASGRELWISDGTPAGTQLLKDVNPGAASGLLGIGSSEFTIFDAAAGGGGNLAPTAVEINTTTASLAENAATAAHIKVGDIVVTDDGHGTNSLALTGADAAVFEIVGTELFLKAGTKLDFETKTSYSVAVTVDDATVGGVPDATSTTFTLNVSNVSPEIIIGTAAGETLTGGADADWIFGLAGTDTIGGLGGNDIETGGLGRDKMTGGTGADVFDFNNKLETGKTAATRDVITDFTHKVDHIDVSTIDANGSLPKNGVFKFLQGNGTAFTGVNGELHWFQLNPKGTVNDKTIVEGDVNGDKVADFQIELTGLKTLTKGDFIL